MHCAAVTVRSTAGVLTVSSLLLSVIFQFDIWAGYIEKSPYCAAWYVTIPNREIKELWKKIRRKVATEHDHLRSAWCSWDHSCCIIWRFKVHGTVVGLWHVHKNTRKSRLKRGIVSMVEKEPTKPHTCKLTSKIKLYRCLSSLHIIVPPKQFPHYFEGRLLLQPWLSSSQYGCEFFTEQQMT